MKLFICMIYKKKKGGIFLKVVSIRLTLLSAADENESLHKKVSVSCPPIYKCHDFHLHLLNLMLCSKRVFTKKSVLDNTRKRSFLKNFENNVTAFHFKEYNKLRKSSFNLNHT